MTATDYRKAMEGIHASEELKKATIQKMQKQKITKRHVSRLRYISIAACACLFVFWGGYYYHAQYSRIYIKQVSSLEISSGSIGVQTGKVDSDTGKKDIFITETYQNREFIPEALWDTNPSMIRGRKVYLCFEEETQTYYAAAKQNGKYLLFQGRNTKESEFVQYLKSCFTE